MFMPKSLFTLTALLSFASMAAIEACVPAPSVQPTATLIPLAPSAAKPTLPPSPILTPTVTASPATAQTPTASPAINPYGTVSHIGSADSHWIAALDTRVGSLDLRRQDGRIFAVFPPGSTAQTVSWSPDSRRLLVVQTHWLLPQPNVGVVATAPIQIWQVPVDADRPGQPALMFEPNSGQSSLNGSGPSQIDFGAWSPNSRHALFWLGPLSASIQADGEPLFALDAETGKTTQLADIALLNRRYQSWSPDSSALAFTAGGYRSAQADKWLDLFDVATGAVTTVVSETEAIPGIIAWSPRGDWIAYAALAASDVGSGLADWMSFDNPAILARRVYLLNPKTNEHHRLNQVEAFQDAPIWSDDGNVLYYVQRDGGDLVLMTANPVTGQAQVIENSRRPAPAAVGYYGQSSWDDLLAYCPAANHVPVPPLTQTYTDPAHTFALQYPAGWFTGRGWETTLYRCDDCATIGPEEETGRMDFGPFSGRTFISIQVVPNSGADLDALTARALANPGPGQYPGSLAMTVFDKRSTAVNGQAAMRLESMDEIGTINHVLIVLDSDNAFILLGRGDARVFDAIAATLKVH